ncbi:carbohydrate kinase family protein [Mesotoga sp.]|uniref:carbohydrate kinase family protein n=1 Tax=Mesotoga sp. TaxID=2053577 RepID=UPI00345EBE93
MDRVVVVGNVDVDIIAGPIDDWPEWGTEIGVDTVDMRIGGQAANTAVVLADLGVPVDIVTVAGNDLFGKALEQRFVEMGISVEGLDLIEGKTPHTVAVTHTNSERSFLSDESVMRFMDVDFVSSKLAKVKGAHILFCGINVLRGLRRGDLKTLLESLQDDNVIYLDPGWPPDGWKSFRPQIRSLLNSLDWFLPNEAELIAVTQKSSISSAVESFQRDFASSAMVKMGSEGSLMISRENSKEYSTERSENVVDTIGAGDSFNAGFICSAAANGSYDVDLAHRVARDWIEGRYREKICL